MVKTIDIKSYIEGIAYKKELTYTKEEVNGLLATAQENLQDNIDAKADQTDLEALTTTVSGKAAQTDLDALTTTVNSKAAQADLAALTTTVASKAAQSDLDSLSATVATKAAQTDLANLTTTVAGKADAQHTHAPDQILFDQGTENQANLVQKLQAMGSAITALQTADWDIEIVTSLPQTGVAGKLYFLHDADANETTGDNHFDEYIYNQTTDKFEKLGQRTIDLSSYVTDVEFTWNEGVLGVSLVKGSDAFGL